jgi:hypothetical protein
MGDSRIKDVSSLLAAFFDEEKLSRGGRYAEFFGSWKAIAGERLAAHSRISDIDKGLLIVEAEHPGWIQLLQIRQTEILSAVTQRYPELGLRGVIFRLAQESAAGLRAPAGKGQESTQDTSEPEQLAGKPAFIDPELQSLFERLKDTMENSEDDS